MFCKDFSIIAAPITWLTKKDVQFEWGPEQKCAQETIIQRITNAPVLIQPDPMCQFELKTDASLIGTGAVLYQCNPPITLPDGTQKPGPRRPCRFHSQSFTSTEWNYPIYDHEFLGVLRGLCCWSHLLKGTGIPVLVYTDHANLKYYQEPRKIGPHITGYILELAQYNLLLKYKPGTTNWADALCRRPDYEVKGNPDNEDVTVLPDNLFCITHTAIHVFDMDSIHDSLEQWIKCTQYPMQSILKQWAPVHNLSTINGTHWYKGPALVVVADNTLRRGVITLFHDHKASGHPGITKTLQLIAPYYWWPNMKTFVMEYIKGCATCQMSKINHNPSHPPLFPISPIENARPFETIALNFITKLPLSGGYNTILTIRHRLLKGFNLPPLQWNHRLRRSGHTLCHTCNSTLWHPLQSYIRQGCMLHFQIHHRPLPPPRHSAKYQHSLPPSNRWSQQKNKSNTQAILMNLLWYAAEQLAHMAPIYKELLAICNHKENTIQPSYRIHFTNPPTNIKNQHTLHRTKTLSSKGSQERHPRGPEKSARNLDKR